MALATDSSRVPGRSEGAITSMDVIAAWDAASQALARLGKRCGGGGVLLLNSIITKREILHIWDTPVLSRSKCDPVPPHGSVRSPKSKKEKYNKEKRKTKAKQHHSGGVHAWRISPV